MMRREYVATAYVVHEDKVLLVHHKRVGQCIAVGGHVEDNETPCETVKREVKEETGLEIAFDQSHLTAPDNPKMVYLPKPNHIQLEDIDEEHQHVDLMYFVKADKTEVENLEDHKGLKWFTAQDLEEEDLWPDVKFWAKKAIEEVNQR